MKFIDDLLETDISMLSPIITIGNLLNTFYSLQEKGVSTELNQFIIPALISIYGSSIFGNIIIPQFSFSTNQLVLFFTSLLSFVLVFKNAVYLGKLVKIFPIIGKGMFFISLKNNLHPLHDIIGYMMVLEVSGHILSMLILGKPQIEYSSDELNSFVIHLIILAISRKVMLQDHQIFSIVFLLGLLPVLKKLIKKYKKKAIRKGSSKKLSSPNSLNKRKVRKSSLTALAG